MLSSTATAGNRARTFASRSARVIPVSRRTPTAACDMRSARTRSSSRGYSSERADAAACSDIAAANSTSRVSACDGSPSGVGTARNSRTTAPRPGSGSSFTSSSARDPSATA